MRSNAVGKHLPRPWQKVFEDDDEDDDEDDPVFPGGFAEVARDCMIFTDHGADFSGSEDD